MFIKKDLQKDLKLEIEIDQENLLAKFTKGKRKPKTYRFKSINQMLKYIDDEVEMATDTLNRNLAYKDECKQKKEKVANEVKVGDVFCYSWGWEQTNIDFFQVLEKTSRYGMIVRAIRSKTKREISWGSEDCVPDIDNFMNSAEKVILNNRGEIKRGNGSAYLVTDITKGVYRSWYA